MESLPTSTLRACSEMGGRLTSSTTVAAQNASAFFNAAVDARRCMRCSKAVMKSSIISKSGKDKRGLYALVAQVMSDESLVGGMLCDQCVKSFRHWMKEGEER